RLPVQFLKIRQAHAANIQLTQGRLPDREASDSQVIHSVPTAVQKARTLQIRQKTVNRAHRQPGAAGNLFRGEPIRRLAEDLEKAQPALQRRDVVAPFWSVGHASLNKIRQLQNESANYLMKVEFVQEVSFLTAFQTS